MSPDIARCHLGEKSLVENHCCKPYHSYFMDEEIQVRTETYRKTSVRIEAGGLAPGPRLLATVLNCLFGREIQAILLQQNYRFGNRLDDRKGMKE